MALDDKTKAMATAAMEQQIELVDRMVMLIADEMDTLEKEGLDRMTMFASAYNSFIVSDEKDPLNRDAMATLLFAAGFRLAEGYRTVKKQEQKQAAELSALFDGNRRLGL